MRAGIVRARRGLRGVRRAPGFSLVEVLCAILVLGVGLVGVTEAITLALRTSKDAEQHTVAVMLARGRLETLRADSLLTEGENEGEFEDAFSGYTWHEAIAETDTDGLYEVVVTIRLAATGQVAYELGTLLFDTPYTSIYDSDYRDDLGPGGVREGSTGL